MVESSIAVAGQFGLILVQNHLPLPWGFGKRAEQRGKQEFPSLPGILLVNSKRNQL